MNSVIFYDKRGDTQIDTIISIALFVLYLIVVFFFITPSLKSNVNPNQETKTIEKNLEQLYAEVNKLMLYVRSNISSDEPLILNFPLNWSSDNIMVTDNKDAPVDFYIDEGKILLYYNLSSKNVFYIIHSKYNFSNQTRSSEITVGNENYTTTQNLRVEFSDFFVKNVSFNGSVLVNDFNILINNASFHSSNSSFLNKGFVNLYKVYSSGIKESIYIFKDKERIYSFFENENFRNQSNSNISYNILMTFSIANFTNFYSDNLNSGIINYSYENCYNFNSDYVDFYDEDKGLSFILSNFSEISFCSEDDSIILNISSTLDDLFSCTIVAHNSSYSTLQFKGFYYYAYGFAKELSGIYYDYLENSSLVNNILSKNLSPSKKFRVSMRIGNSVFYYGNETIENLNIYARTVSKPILHRNGSYENEIITIATW
ncbi:MAG: hypothetical protein ACP5OZ_03200 [Candidatus Woesearchaeota archaeon]